MRDSSATRLTQFVGERFVRLRRRMTSINSNVSAPIVGGAHMGNFKFARGSILEKSILLISAIFPHTD